VSAPPRRKTLRMASAITAREFKLLLKPEGFPTKRSVLDFNNRLAKMADDLGVEYEGFDRVDSELREVRFFDTSDAVFRKNRVILRLRRDRSSGWPDETWEVTFKRRSPDFRESADFDVNSTMKDIPVKMKFKEEIIRGDAPRTIKSIFSNNYIGFYPVQNFEAPMSRIIEVFPGLKALSLDPNQDIAAVNHAAVLEIGARLGVFTFGKNAVAHADLAVWTRPVADKLNVMVAEFGWSYHMRGETGKDQKAHEAADNFFKQVQEPLQAELFDGTTKTALLYGDKEA
jgi:hypothetical protein